MAGAAEVRAADPSCLRRSVISESPFLGVTEVVAGIFVLEAPDHAAALAIARRNPILHFGGVEVRAIAS